jgi:DNA polymerase (family 10)
MENAEIARLFREFADLLELEQANPFRVRAYRTAARTVESHPEPLAEIALRHPEELTLLPGVGDDLAGKIVEIVRTGRLHALQEAVKRTPPSLIALTRLPGLGPLRVRRLFHELGVHTLADLRQAISSGRLSELSGFGEKSVDKLRRALEAPAAEEKRVPLPVASQYAEAIIGALHRVPGLREVEVAGSFRRRRDTVGDLDILAAADETAPVIERFLEFPEVAEILARGTTKAAIRLRSGLQIDLRVLERESFGAGLYYFTGSKAHNIAVRKRAQARGLKVNEYGVWKGERRIAGATERQVAAAIGLPLIPPELREDRGEIEAAEAGRLPRLVTREAIRGDLHSHTTASDGRASLAEMVRAAQQLGYSYLAITDHSPLVRVAGGLDREGFRRQRRAIDRLNRELDGFRVLAGAEVDILPDGSLDLDDDTLWSLDLVVASVHSSLTLAAAAQTRRVLRALQHPAVDILGHPTGRLIGRRAPMALDLEAIARTAADHGVLLEVNAQPDRLDLDDIAIQAALRHGAHIAISTDAHAPAELQFMQWGVNQARRGWATAAAVANTQSLTRLLNGFHRERSGQGHRTAAIHRPGDAVAVVRGRPHSGRSRRGAASRRPAATGR